MTKTTKPAPSASAERMAAMRATRAAKKASEPAKKIPEGAPPAATLTAESVAQVAPTTMERAALTADAKRAAKVAALRAAKVSSADPVGEAIVVVRVTKKGHGQVSMGEHINGLGDLTFDHNEEPSFPLSIAQELEDRGFVEIQ